jgi:kynurenine formamidase
VCPPARVDATRAACAHDHHDDQDDPQGSGAYRPPAVARSGRSRVVDLTHPLRKSFPTVDGEQPTDDVAYDRETFGFYAKRWSIAEHTGTHIDAPGHFNESMRLVDDLTADELVAPLVVIDIRAKARRDANATVDPDDLTRFERRHGPIPSHALVCMHSGWAAKASDPGAYLGGPGFPELNFPGFGVEATDWLLSHRSPVGIGVDTPSLDPGSSTTLDVHHRFLAADRYGLENLAGLDHVPSTGAEAFVGAIPWEMGSGSPCRVLAVV